jgi:hypothetical protein
VANGNDLAPKQIENENDDEDDWELAANGMGINEPRKLHSNAERLPYHLI